jgi:hypothetical protein
MTQTDESSSEAKQQVLVVMKSRMKLAAVLMTKMMWAKLMRTRRSQVHQTSLVMKSARIQPYLLEQLVLTIQVVVMVTELLKVLLMSSVVRVAIEMMLIKNQT